ncbi:hypothetical protein [Haladaptatus sp. R4]|uniref:hypothetical protein n=1 Tax=Haladaptatus sp. R4 TaxID=1679489 RepID=UPI000AFE5A53|nr:hypothetical protein [Haladaptatus sp. R4]
MKRNSNGGVNRRSLMAGIAASASAGSIIQPVSAESEKDGFEQLNEIRDKYESVSTVQTLIKDSPQLFQTLEQDNILQKDDLEVNNLLCTDEYLASDNGARVWGVSHPADDKPTAHVTIRRKIPAGKLVIAFNPDRSDTKPRALLRKKVPETGGSSIQSSRYIVEKGDLKKDTKTIVPQRPKELDLNEAEKLSTSQGYISPQGMIIYLCRNRGDSGCGAYRCYSWEGECLGESCTLYDCTGSICCGGCCCCGSQDRCCEVCGDYQCTHPPGCRPDSFSCSSGTGCSNCCYSPTC